MALEAVVSAEAADSAAVPPEEAAPAADIKKQHGELRSSRPTVLNCPLKLYLVVNTIDFVEPPSAFPPPHDLSGCQILWVVEHSPGIYAE